FSQAPTVSYEEIADQIERELGKPPSELFASIEEVPSAAASLGQVHRAALKSGEKVVVKVQYPGVETAMADDLRNMKSLIKSIGLAGPLLDRRDYAEELEREIAAELDYSRELKWAEAFREYLKPWPDLVVPKMHPELSSKRVLTMEWLEGEPLHAFSAREDLTPAQRFRTGEQLVRALWAPFLFHRAIQGDAHPGNYLVMHNGRLGVLDFGCIKVLSESFWRANVEAVSHALFDTRADLVSSLKASGFQFGMPDQRADALLRGLADVVMSPLKGPFDFSDDALIRQVKALKRANPLELLRVKPPAEGLLFYRAMAGTRTNLSRLKASGDFRPFFRDAIPLAAAKT
ncbi:MAG: ABC1 kinase family protein, partial [Myxococcaceae bacterium]